jgi:hypothetical protein
MARRAPPYARRHRHNFSCQGEAFSAGLGESCEFFKPGGARSLQMDAGVETLERRMNRRIDGELIDARMDAELEVVRQPMVVDGVGDSGDIVHELKFELPLVADIIHALAEAAAKLGSDGLNRKSFLANRRQDNQQLYWNSGRVALVHRYLGYEVAGALRSYDLLVDLPGCPCR